MAQQCNHLNQIDAKRTRLRGLSQDRGHLGSSEALPKLRSRWLLRFIKEQARHQALSQNLTSDHQVVRDWRELALVLSGSVVHGIINGKQ